MHCRNLLQNIFELIISIRKTTMMNRSQFIRLSSMGAVTLPVGLTKKSEEKRELIKPKRLEKGNKVAFTAPAGLLHDHRDFRRMREVMESMGLEVVFGEFVRERHGYFAGTDYQRALDLMRFFDDDTVDAIVAVRGGWGCARILPHLDYNVIKANPKIYCGFSDNTTLHLAFNKHCGLVTYHGPNGASEWTDITKSSFIKTLMDGEDVMYTSPQGFTVINPGVAKGRLIGGNLTILTTAIGTDYQPDLTDSILFVEDIAEPPYKIDRMLTHLKRSNMLDKLSGFIFGQCTNCAEPRGANFTIEEVLNDHIKPLGIPAMIGKDIGHDPDNLTIPVGLQAELNSKTGTLKALETTVA